MDNIIWDSCKSIFEKIDIELPPNKIFTYLSDSELIDETKIIYKRIDKSFSRQLNNKLQMGLLFDDNRITPKIYTSSEDLLKDNYEKDKIWFIKYIHGSCGKHIMCKTTDQLRSIEISRKFIIQEGIMDLDLYQGYKYTLRTFMILHNKQLYLYCGLKKRIHNVKYDKKSLNYSANVCGSNYSERIPIYLDPQEDLHQKLKVHALLMKEKLKDILEETDEYTYLLIGNDYLVKEDQSLILIEMNTQPYLNNSEEINEKINIPLMKDTIHLVVNNEINNYELIEL